MLIVRQIRPAALSRSCRKWARLPAPKMLKLLVSRDYAATVHIACDTGMLSARC